MIFRKVTLQQTMLIFIPASLTAGKGMEEIPGNTWLPGYFLMLWELLDIIECHCLPGCLLAISALITALVAENISYRWRLPVKVEIGMPFHDLHTNLAGIWIFPVFDGSESGKGIFGIRPFVLGAHRMWPYGHPAWYPLSITGPNLGPGVGNRTIL